MWIKGLHEIKWRYTKFMFRVSYIELPTYIAPYIMRSSSPFELCFGNFALRHSLLHQDLLEELESCHFVVSLIEDQALMLQHGVDKEGALVAVC